MLALRQRESSAPSLLAQEGAYAQEKTFAA